MHCLPRFRHIAPFAVLVAMGCGGGASGPPPECVDDVCPCSEGGIRAAIDEGLGPYTFDCDGPTTVRTAREIVIENDVVFDGEGNLIVDGNQRHRVFSVPEGVTAELVDLTVVNGRLTENEEHGAGIRNEGTLTLTRTTVSTSSAGRDTGCRTDDQALLCSEGGGIWNAGTLTLVESTISESSAHFGGGLANRGGLVTLVDSSVITCSAIGCSVGAVVCSGGGGIWNSGALMMQNSTVSENDADWGAGLYNRDGATLTGSTVSGGSAGFDGGGLLNFETLTLIDTTVADNFAGQSGGGIANEAGSLEVNGSTLSGNAAAAAGGGILNPAGAAAQLVNATISRNMANTGGAIYTGGELLLLSSTIAENDAPDARAIFDPAAPGARVRSIANTVIEGDCEGPQFDSGGYNIESPGNTCGFNQQTDQPSEDQLNLGALDDNGGPTRTHELLQGSVAIDQIPESDCVDGADEPLSADQRGEPRPSGTSGACDVGAFEVQP